MGEVTNLFESAGYFRPLMIRGCAPCCVRHDLMLKLVPSLSHAKNEEGLEYVRAAIVRQLGIRGKALHAQ